MADLGFRTINEMVGRAQFLKKRENIEHWKINKLDLTRILHVAHSRTGDTLYQTEQQDHGLDMILDWGLVRKTQKAMDSKTPVVGQFNVQNNKRTIGPFIY